jgi:hypothetical protein
MSLIEEFITELVRHKNTATVCNPYLNQNIADNLRLYLDAMIKMKGKRVLLVGEAPGYKGCKITGIPFTSGKAFERFDHPLLKEHGNYCLGIPIQESWYPSILELVSISPTSKRQ